MKNFFKSIRERFISSNKNYPVIELDEADCLLINSSCLHCPICYEVFGNAPDMLPCGHSFCTTCVGKLRLDAKYSALSSSFIYECPFCREECSIERTPMRNFAIEAVLESVAENTQAICPEEHLISNLRFTNKRLIRKIAALEESKREMAANMEETVKQIRCTFVVFGGAIAYLLLKYLFSSSLT
ncbi:hypothetical protein L596_003173 [Steinernema carpocapsae]|uniref:RING-type domain-containing protein n=1 Tax=Steinernema carpocapsae TaxID=34508 RepID=A0A4U8UUL5_STECR|nr:hypothetical protein L596_003173 [Steinernema carpocapsae]